VRIPCTPDSHEGTYQDPGSPEKAVLPPVLGFPGAGCYHEDPDFPQPGGGNLHGVWFSPPLPSLSEDIMSQNRTSPRKKTGATAPGGYHDLKPTIWIGKQGVTDTIIDEIRAQVRVRKVIKVKWLESTGVDPQEVAGESGTNLLQVRGRTIVLGEKGSDPETRPRNI
jgi:RNA-binding protein